MKIIVALAILLVTACEPVSFGDPVRVFRADLLNSPPGTPLIGSLAGGATLIIKGTGFDGLTCNHEVLVGNISCSTANLSCNWEIVQCEMPASETAKQNLSITVRVIGKGADTCSS